MQVETAIETEPNSTSDATEGADDEDPALPNFSAMTKVPTALFAWPQYIIEVMLSCLYAAHQALM